MLYIVFHLLAFVNRQMHPNADKAFAGSWFPAIAILGAIGTIVGLYYAFAGAHVEFGRRALIVIIIAFIAAVVSFLAPSGEALTTAQE